jgi:hypothetical protein
MHSPWKLQLTVLVTAQSNGVDPSKLDASTHADATSKTAPQMSFV